MGLYRFLFPRVPEGGRRQERRTLLWSIIGAMGFCVALGFLLYYANIKYN